MFNQNNPVYGIYCFNIFTHILINIQNLIFKENYPHINQLKAHK